MCSKVLSNQKTRLNVLWLSGKPRVGRGTVNIHIFSFALITILRQEPMLLIFYKSHFWGSPLYLSFICAYFYVHIFQEVVKTVTYLTIMFSPHCIYSAYVVKSFNMLLSHRSHFLLFHS